MSDSFAPPELPQPVSKGKAMGLDSIGALLVVGGLGMAALGGLLVLFSRIPGLNQFGRLPGDIQVQTGNLSCFFPIVSMILLSVVLTIVLNIIARILNK